MRDVSTTKLLNFFRPFSYRVRNSLGVGVSAGGAGTIIHLASEATASEIEEANLILDGAEILTVITSKVTIVADGIDEAVITCSELPLLFDCVEFLDSIAGTLYTVNDGALELSSIKPGTLELEIQDPNSYRTGLVTIEITEPEV